MKKSLLKFIIVLALAAIAFSGCQKDIKEKEFSATSEVELQLAQDKQKNECRLTKMTFPDGEYIYHYNNQGLADEWDIANYGLFKQEYDKNGRLKISKFYIGTELINTIHFIYEKDKVVKEIWYNGNTLEIGDEIFYTYNKKGKMIRMESFMNDYYTITTYTQVGNTSSWKFFIGGNPFYEGYLTHTRPVKNPYLAVHGIEHGFPFVNASYVSDKWWAAGEKIIIYDENGAPVVLYDYDPSKTIWNIGHQNYPRSVTNFDLISESWKPATFEYENCGRDDDDHNSQITVTPPTFGTKKINHMILLKYHPSKSIKEQARDLRRQLLNRNK